MPITHFKIVSRTNADLINIDVDGSPLVLGQEYPIALENTLEFTKIASFNTYTSLYYVAIDNVNNRQSDETLFNFLFLPDFSGNPLPEALNSADLTLTNSQVLNFIDYIQPNNDSQWVMFKSFGGILRPKINRLYVDLDKRIYFDQARLIDIIAPDSGGTKNLFTATYELGSTDPDKPNVDISSADITTVFDLAIDAEIDLLSLEEEESIEVFGEKEESFNSIRKNFQVKISKAPILGLANLTIDVAGTFLSANEYNNVVISGYKNEDNPIDDSEPITSNINYTKEVSLDPNGKSIIDVFVEVVVVDAVVSTNGIITITLDDVNGIPGDVSVTKNEYIIEFSVEEGDITFDNNDITWDTNAITWDNNNE